MPLLRPDKSPRVLLPYSYPGYRKHLGETPPAFPWVQLAFWILVALLIAL